MSHPETIAGYFARECRRKLDEVQQQHAPPPVREPSAVVAAVDRFEVDVARAARRLRRALHSH